MGVLGDSGEAGASGEVAMLSSTWPGASSFTRQIKATVALWGVCSVEAMMSPIKNLSVCWPLAAVATLYWPEAGASAAAATWVSSPEKGAKVLLLVRWTGLSAARVRQAGSWPVFSTYSRKEGMFRARHLEVELREMDISSWLTKGLLNRS